MGNRPYLNYLNSRSFFGWMFFVVVSLFLLINGEFAEAAPGAKSPVKAKNGSSSNQFDCSKGSIKIDQLKFVGQSFTGNTYCISARSDAEASGKCAAGYKFINPGNPDYHSGGNTSYGNQSSNNLGYYFCNNGVTKEAMCKQAKSINQTYLWSAIPTSKHKDGTCNCDRDGNPRTKLEDCSIADAVVAKAEEKKCTGDGQTDDGKVNGSCICKEGFTPKTATGKDTQNLTCEKNATAEEKVPPSDVGTSDAMKACVAQYVAKAMLCKTKSDAASKKCDQNNSENEQIAKSIRDTDEIAKAFQEKGQQLGQVQTCFKAGLVSNTGSAYLNSLKNDCNKDIESCSDDCSKEVMDEQEKKCSDLIATKASGENVDADAGAGATLTATQQADETYFKEAKEQIHSKFLDGINKCKIAEKNRSLIDKSLSALSGAINSALNCSCQLSANKSAVCSSTDMDCSNPLNPGCQDLNILNVCTFGSTSYNAAACACVQTPQAKGCPEYLEKNNMNSGFAGADIKGLTNGPPSGGFTSTPTSGGGDDNSVDLGGGHADVATPVAKSNATGANFLAGGGGGAGGGASAPGGGSDGGQGGQGGGGEGPAEQKSLGVFGSLKSIVGSMFGGSNNKGSAGGNSGPGGRGGPNPNMDKFRPGLRGVASSGLGGRSGNIFELIKRQYVQQDSSAYIQGP